MISMRGTIERWLCNNAYSERSLIYASGRKHCKIHCRFQTLSSFFPKFSKPAFLIFAIMIPYSYKFNLNNLLLKVWFTLTCLRLYCIYDYCNYFEAFVILQIFINQIYRRKFISFQKYNPQVTINSCSTSIISALYIQLNEYYIANSYTSM